MDNGGGVDDFGEEEIVFGDIDHGDTVAHGDMAVHLDMEAHLDMVHFLDFLDKIVYIFNITSNAFKMFL